MTPSNDTQLKYFVGRRRELDLLWNLVTKSRNGNGQTVFITGEAGIGKTALIRMIIERIISDSFPAEISIGNCSELIGKSEPFSPFFQILDNLIGNEKTIRDKEMVDYLGAVAPSWIYLLPNYRNYRRLIETNPMKESESEIFQQPIPSITAQQNPVIQEYTSIITKLSEKKCLILVLEDLHWIDTSSINLLFYLARKVSSYPILILGTLRPSDIDERKGLSPLLNVKYELEQHGKCIEIPLELLSFNEFMLYGKYQFPKFEFHEESLISLHHKSSGNPLFMVEMFRLIKEEELITFKNGKWEITSELDISVVPSTLEGLLRKRIGLLTKSQRRTLQYASIEGEHFSSTPLRSLLNEKSELILLERLDHLENKFNLIKLYDAEKTIFFKEGTRYSFVHALVQRYCYDRLGVAQRRLLHRKLGNILEKLYSDNQNSILTRLAVHFERGGDYNKAIEYYLKGIDRAIQTYAFQEAVDIIERAIGILNHLSEQSDVRGIKAELIVKKISAYALLGVYSAALNNCDACEALCEDINQKPLRIDVDTDTQNIIDEIQNRQIDLLLIDERIADYPLSVDIPLSLQKERIITEEKIVELELKLASKKNENERNARIDRYCISESYRWRAYCHAHKESVDYDKSIYYYKLALENLESLDNIPQKSIFLLELGDAYRRQGKTDEAIEALENSLSIQKDYGQFSFRALTMLNIAWVYLRNLKEFKRALSYCEEGLKLCETYPDDRTRQQLLRASGTAYRQLGNYEISEFYYRSALDVAVKIGDGVQEAITINSLGVFYTDAGEWSKALECYSNSLKVRLELGAVVGVEYHNIGCAYQRIGQWEEAQSYFEKSLSIYQEGNGLYGMFFSFRALGSLYYLLGDIEKSSYYSQKSMVIAQSEGYPAKGILLLKANISLIRDRLLEALDYYKQSAPLRGGIESQIRSLSRTAICYCINGMIDDGLKSIEKASDIALESGNKFGIAIADLFFSKVLFYRQEHDTAIEKAMSSLLVLKSLGAYQAADANYTLACIHLQKQDSTNANNYLIAAKEQFSSLGQKHKLLETHLLEAIYSNYLGNVEHTKSLINEVKSEAALAGFKLLERICSENLAMIKERQENNEYISRIFLI
jgi:tetratricopeptide (TPR) repeat protein